MSDRHASTARKDTRRRVATHRWGALLAVASAALLVAPACSNGNSSGPGSPLSPDDASTGPCAIDCSTIPAPACEVAQCNVATRQCDLVPAPDDSPCDDGLFCTVGETCKAGVCQGQPNDCGQTAPACTSVACDEASKSCSLTPQPDGTACSDVCVTSGACSAGVCVGQAKSCASVPVPDPCHVATCNPATGACDLIVPGNERAPCQTDPCSVGAACQGGECQGGKPRSCGAWADECNTAACDTAHHGCYSVPAKAGAACASGDPCNAGTCDAAGQCHTKPANNGGMCSDGITCDTSDACSNGVCVGTGGPQVFFSDTFASDARGWATDPPWQIGAALDDSGSSATGYLCKPDTDHTGWTDNGVATTVIGGDDGTVVHDFAYLTSPAIDTSGSSSLVLEFWYVIYWDTPPAGDAVVEVWNGATWVRVWQNTPDDSAQCGVAWAPNWKDARIDVSAYKGSAMKVRFGEAAYAVDPNPGWTVDDVSIMSASCP